MGLSRLNRIVKLVNGDYERKIIVAGKNKFISISPKVFMKDWIKALRSGSYRQTKGSLSKKNPESGRTHYCCLGVACRVAALKGIKAGKDQDIASGLPDTWIENLIGCYNPRVRIPEKNNDTELSECNDDHRKTFKQIADLIEEQLLPKASNKVIKFEAI